MRIREHSIRKTVLATTAILVVFFAQGAAVIIGGLEGWKAIITQASIIWGGALATILFFLIKDHSLKNLGFQKPISGMSKRLLYYFPLIIVAMISFTGGIISENVGMMIPNLVFTLGIGLAEELYFRGIICNIWKEKENVAIILSSVLFGLSHLLNMMGGAGIAATLLQIAFAFIYGVVMAIIFLRTKSIWQCIILHAIHDFCGFITSEDDMKMVIIAGAVQFVVLLAYCIYLIVVLKKEKNR